MTEIRNLLFQPLTFQLAGQDRGLHLGSRQRKLIEDDQVSEEIRTAAKRGFIALTSQDEPQQSEEQPVLSENCDSAPENAIRPSIEPAADEPVPASSEALAPEADASGTDPEASETAGEPLPRKRR